MRRTPPVATLVVMLLVAGTLAGCMDGSNHAAGNVAILTSEGCIVLELFPDDAPRTVENFVQYVEDGFYEGTRFHRIMQTFMIQGGGFAADDMQDQKQTRDPIPLEYKLPNLPYTISMARTGDPNSATSQFFISTVDNTESLGPGPDSDGYAAFGKVIEGIETVDRIAAHPVGPNPANPRETSGPENPEPYIIEANVGTSCPNAPPPPEPVHGVEAGLIHDTFEGGVWTVNVSGRVDFAPAYVMNTGNQDDTFRVQIQGPAHWEVGMQPAPIPLAKNGTKAGPGYGYARHAMISVHYNETRGTAGDDDRVTVSIVSDGDPNAYVDLVLAPRLMADYPAPVTQVGDEVALTYRGYFDDDETFIESRGAETRTVGFDALKGFAYGIVGLAAGEAVTLRFPPELGYGNDNPETSRLAQFNHEWLNYDVLVERVGSDAT